MSACLTTAVGDAQVALIPDGHLVLSVAELFPGVPPAAWAGRLPDAGEGRVVVPVHTVLVRADEAASGARGRVPARASRCLRWSRRCRRREGAAMAPL